MSTQAVEYDGSACVHRRKEDANSDAYKMDHRGKACRLLDTGNRAGQGGGNQSQEAGGDPAHLDRGVYLTRLPLAGETRVFLAGLKTKKAGEGLPAR